MTIPATFLPGTQKKYASSSGTVPPPPDAPGIKLPFPLYAPWTYPGGIPKGVVNGFKVMPHTLSNTNPLTASVIPGTTALEPSSVIPVPKPLPSAPPPRSRDMNKMDSGGEMDHVTGMEEKIGEAEIGEISMTGDAFRVHVTEKNGDCFFDSVRQALASLKPPKIVTIEQLRAAVASKVLTPDKDGIDNNIMLWQTIYNEAKNADDREMMTEYGHIACVADEMLPLDKQGREKLYAAMMTPSYWAEEYAVSIIEKALQIKFIIIDGVAEKALAGHDHGMHFDPKFYVILVLKNKHYQPVSSHHRFCFRRSELPKDVVEKVQHDCGDSPYPYISLKTEIHRPNQIAALPVL